MAFLWGGLCSMKDSWSRKNKKMRFFLKKISEMFAGIKKSSTFALSNENNTVGNKKWPRSSTE